VWATPALANGLVIVPTDDGRVLGLDQLDGTERWVLRLPGPLWQSPVVVDDVLIQGDCEGVMHGFDVADPAVEPTELWAVEIGGCIESTPAVWEGQIFIGSRNGFFYALG
jgi:outer membrane protein assembly factor BamB